MAPSIALDWDALLAQLNRRVGLETSASVTEIDRSMIRPVRRCDRSGEPVVFQRGIRADDAVRRDDRAARVRLDVRRRSHSGDLRHGTGTRGRTLHTDDTARTWRPIRPGDRITSFARYAGAMRKDRDVNEPMLFQSADLILDDALQQPVAQVRIVSVSF